MCGRFYYLAEGDEVRMGFPQLVLPEDPPKRYNIAPGHNVTVIVRENGVDRMKSFRWGLVPSWAKDAGIGGRLINARAETVAEKPAFRSALRHRRCLILANGFYEWYQEPGRKGKTPLRFELRSGKPLAFAGLWEMWHPQQGAPLYTCTILTTHSNELIAPFHERMPVILHPEDYDRWLAPGELSSADLAALLKPYPAAEMVAYPVSTLCNSVGIDSPQCLEPIGPMIYFEATGLTLT